MHPVHTPAAHPAPVAGLTSQRAAGPLLATSTVAMGLMAGLFFAFDVSVMPGLRRADDRTFVIAMRNVNEAIENGLFGLVFVGAFVATGVAAVVQRRLGHRRGARWTWAALALYTLCLVLTMGVEIPLNDQLARAGTAFGEARKKFEDTWAGVNVLRTLTCTAALGCVSRALFLHGGSAAGAHLDGGTR